MLYLLSGRRLPSLAILAGVLLMATSAHAQSILQIPRTFEANQGQTDRQVRFLSRGHGSTVFLTKREAVLVLQRPGKPGETVRLQFQRTNSAVEVRGDRELPGKSHYFIGNDPRAWHTNVPHYARVIYDQVYPGVDLVFYSRQHDLEFDLIVAPGVDPSIVTVAIGGARAALNESGDLVLKLSDGELIVRKPIIYQQPDGARHTVPGHYRLKSKNVVAFDVGRYDASRPLVIDPTLTYVTYLGGAGTDTITGIQIDAFGNVYIAGSTTSPDFPVSATPRQPTNLGGTDAVITKLNPAATGSAQLVYSTYLGGTGNDAANGISISGAGIVTIGGTTASNNFPTTASTFATNFNGPSDGFVARLNPGTSGAGGLFYSTYLGGTGVDEVNAVAVDGSGNIYVTGNTVAPDFPTTATAFQTSPVALGEAFVSKLTPAGLNTADLLYSSYLGGDGSDIGLGIAVNGTGHIFVTGSTQSTNFPLSATRFDNTKSGTQDAFMSRLNPAGSGASDLIYSTYLGGDGNDSGNAITLDASSLVYVAGNAATNFPISSSPQGFDGTLSGTDDAFVTKLNTALAGSAGLLYSTYLGGNGSDTANAIAVDTTGLVFITGRTLSTDFPLAGGPFQSTKAAFEDAFVVKLNPAVGPSTALVYGSYLGANGTDTGNAIALDSTDNAFVAGATGSTDFPVTTVATATTIGAFQTAYGGGTSDGFIAKVIDMPSTPSSPSTGSGKCFIATAAFGSPMAAEVQTLRRFRDRHLLTHAPGRLLVAGYYAVSPPIADAITHSDAARAAVRTGLRPIIWFAELPPSAMLLGVGTTGLVLAFALTSRLLIRRPRRVFGVWLFTAIVLSSTIAPSADQPKTADDEAVRADVEWSTPQRYAIVVDERDHTRYLYTRKDVLFTGPNQPRSFAIVELTADAAVLQETGTTRRITWPTGVTMPELPHRRLLAVVPIKQLRYRSLSVERVTRPDPVLLALNGGVAILEQQIAKRPAPAAAEQRSVAMTPTAPMRDVPPFLRNVRVQEVSPNHYEVQGDALQASLQNAGQLFSDLKLMVSPSVTAQAGLGFAVSSALADGVLNQGGFTVTNSKVAAMFGIEPGDTILTVNGQAVNSPLNAWWAYQEGLVKNPSQAEMRVDIRRGTGLLSKTYRIQ